MPVTTGPRTDTTRNPTLTKRGYQTPFINYQFSAETLKAELDRLETEYKKNPTVSRSVFVQSQLNKIRQTYQYFYDSLNDLSIQNLNIPVESLLAQVTSTAGQYVSEPFGVILKGFTLMFTNISAQAQAENQARIQQDSEFYIGQLTRLQAMYDVYKKELAWLGYKKLAIVGLPALALLLQYKNGNNKTG